MHRLDKIIRTIHWKCNTCFVMFTDVKEIPSIEKENRLPTILSTLEGWVFSLAGYICWMMTANPVNNALGQNSIVYWIPGILFGTLFLLQIKQVGLLFPHVNGGIASYITRLYDFNKPISKYAAWAYYIGWAGVPAIYPFILSNLIEENLKVFDIQISMLPIQLLLLCLGFMIGMTSTKALSTLQVIVTIPALIVTLIFISSGVLLLFTGTIQPATIRLSEFNVNSMWIWFFITSYIAYTGESSAVFAGESKNPKKVLQALNITALLKPLVFGIGVFILSSLVPKGLNILPSQAIELAGIPIFGQFSSVIGTGLVVSSLLLSTTLTVALAPRVLYQLSKDGLAHPLFGFISKNGTPRVGVFATFVIALVTFFIGNLDKILIGTGAAFLMSLILFHWGIIRKRKEVGLKMIYFTGFTLIFEILGLLIGGYLIDPLAVTLGLLSPFGFILADSYIMKTKMIAFLHNRMSAFYKFLTVQTDSISSTVVAVLLVMLSSSGVSWVAASYLSQTNLTQSINLYISAIIILGFLAVAIVSYSVIPQFIKLNNQKSTIEVINNKLVDTLGKYEKSNKQLENLAFTDQLTKLNNENFLKLKLQECISNFENHGQQYCFCILDIDRFKVVNDSLGYVVGDKLLVSIGKIIQEELSDNAIVARMGGDEFGMIITNFKSRKTVDLLIKKLIKKISSPVPIGERTLFITSCIGIVYGSSDYTYPQLLLQDANIAKHKAKKDGNNKIVSFSKVLKREVIELEKLERELKHAVANNLFTVYLQPIFNLKTNSCTMAESLIRWIRPDGTMIPPSLFIPLAEETGLINDITWWSVRSSCEALQELTKKTGVVFSMSINMSPESFRDPNLESKLLDICKIYNVKPSQLILEITEHTILENSDGVISSVDSLKKIGIKIGLDDFGTGYSNLKYLNTMPIDELKVDMSFTQNINTVSGFHIVETMTMLSKKLQMQTVFEGVETPEQLQTIISLDENSCIQGYIFAKPQHLRDINISQLEKEFIKTYLSE